MAFAELGEVRLFYTDDGVSQPGTPLLLVHGWGADSHDWIWHIPTLAGRRRVIAPDLRGHGYSSVPDSGYHPRDMAGDIAALLAHLGVDRVVAIGHSMGAQIVSVLAVEFPALVEAVVTIDPGYGRTAGLAAYFPTLVDQLRHDARSAAVDMDRWCYTPASPQAIRTWHERRLRAMPEHVLIQAFTALFTDPGQIGCRPASDAYLVRRACPVLTFWFDPAQATWEEALFKHPASRAVVWEGSGHRMHEERPAEFCLVLTQWLDSLDKLEG